MSETEPAKEPAQALEDEIIGVDCVAVCSKTNRSLNKDDEVHVYATWYDRDGWVIRRVYEKGATDAAENLRENPTDGCDEVVAEGLLVKKPRVVSSSRSRKIVRPQLVLSEVNVVERSYP
jgi:hypothetical protein